VEECSFLEMDHSPCSQDLAPSDFYLFRLLKKNLRGRRFHSDDDLKATIDDFFESQVERFFYKGLGSLEEEWSKCTGVGVDYIKKFNDQKNRTSFVS
jgi:hypothetical protein